MALPAASITGRLRDIAPIAGIVRVPLVMEVHPSVPAKTVAEFIAYAKANPGKVNMASAGTGSTPHLAGEMFKTMAGVDLFHVPYRGAQVFPALLTGEAQVRRHVSNVPTSGRSVSDKLSAFSYQSRTDPISRVHPFESNSRFRPRAEDSHNTRYLDVCDVGHFFANVHKKKRQEKTSLLPVAHVAT